MRRRGITVMFGAVLTVLLGVLIGRADVPYVALTPGPTINTLGAVDGDGDACDKSAAGSSCQEVIQITGAPTSTGKGQLRMVTVSVQPNLTLIEAIQGWLSGEDAVVPRKLIYPDDKTEKQVEQENKEDFENSQTSAETVALKELGYRVFVTLTEIAAGGAADGVLKTGDVVDTVDDTPVTSTQKLIELIRAKPVGTTLQVGYTRDGAKATAGVTTKPGEDGKPRIGISAKHVQPHPFELKIKLDKVGGPSAGMIFALGIIDKLKPEDLTNGFVVAGTGTIDDEGNVGPIGGVSQKLYGARDDGATVFLVPALNCDEAKRNVPDGLRLVKVATLDEALAALAALPAGGPLPSC